MRVSNLKTAIIFLAALFAATIANPIPGGELSTPAEKRAVMSDPVATTLPQPTVGPAIDLPVIECQNACKTTRKNCLASDLGGSTP
jgi:hypothetical protein